MECDHPYSHIDDYCRKCGAGISKPCFACKKLLRPEEQWRIDMHRQSSMNDILELISCQEHYWRAERLLSSIKQSP